MESSVRPDKTKWNRTRKCGCDECRFFSLEERPECPMKDDPNAIWLWAIDLSMLGCKDYIDPFELKSKPIPEKPEITEDIDKSGETC